MGYNFTEKDLSLRETLLSGQCFRAKEENGFWTIKAGIWPLFKTLVVCQEDLSPITRDPFGQTILIWSLTIVL